MKIIGDEKSRDTVPLTVLYDNIFWLILGPDAF